MCASIYEKNLKVFREKRPNMASIVDAAPDLSETITIEPSKSGEATAKWLSPKGDVLYLHSRYDPWKEAVRLLKPYHVAEVTELTTWIVLGCGLGYHVLELYRQTTVESILIVIEPDVALFREALKHHDWTSLIENPRIIPLIGDKVNLYDNLKPYLGTIFTSQIKMIPHPPSLRREEAYFTQVRENILDLTITSMVSVITQLSLPYVSFENRIENLAHYVHCPGVDVLENMFEGYPGIVVSAGPSLYKNYHLLEKAKSGAVLIAVSTMLRPMLEKGPTPDFAAIVDYHRISKRYLEGIEDHKDVVVMTSPRTSYPALDSYQGPYVILHDDYVKVILKDMDIKKTFLENGATVAHAAFHLACHLGCDPVILVGQDLGFPDGLSHMPGTAIYRQWFNQTNRFNTFEMKEWDHLARIRGRMFKIKDVHGRRIYTDSQMFGYLQEFERLFKDTPRTVIDATEGGALMEGTEVMTLQQAIATYCSERIPGELREKLKQATRRGPLTPGLLKQIRQELTHRKEELKQMLRIIEKAGDLLKEIRKRHDQGKPADDIVRKTIALKKEIVQYDHVYGMLKYIMPGDQLESVKRDRLIDAKSLEGYDKQKAQRERDIEFVTALLGQAGELEKLFDRGFRKLDLLESRMNAS